MTENMTQQRKIKIPAEWEMISKGGNPKIFREACLRLGIRVKKYGDQTTLAEAVAQEFGQSESNEPLLTQEDLVKMTGLQGYPMRRTKVVEKGMVGYRYETFSGESAFVPLTTEPEGV